MPHFLGLYKMLLFNSIHNLRTTIPSKQHPQKSQYGTQTVTPQARICLTLSHAIGTFLELFVFIQGKPDLNAK